ncbi:hypothetical protein [Cellulomonas sp. Marseille-Q8402]
MAPRPDRPDPSPDGDEPDGVHDASGAPGVPGPRDDRPDDRGERVTDEQWAAIVADLRGEPGPTGAAEPPSAAPAGQDDPRTSSGPAVTYPVAPWVTDRRVVRPARPGDPAGASGTSGTAGGARPGPDDPSLSGRDWDATSQMDDAERRVDDAEHFRPPEPGPVLGGDPLLTMAWFAVAGMPVVWLVVLIAWRGAPAAVMQASVVVFLLGLGVLLWRMPHRKDDRDDDSDGAVV